MNTIFEKPWHFLKDTNGDGIVTITDVINWLIWFFFLPGDCFLYFVITRFPRIAHFFEISVNDYHGFLSGIFSFIVWGFVFFILSTKTAISNQKEVERQQETSQKSRS